MQYEIVDKDLRLLVETGTCKKYIKLSRDKRFMAGLKRVFTAFETAKNADELSNTWSFLQYEHLKHDLSGYSSCRILNSNPMRLIIKEREDKLFVSILRMEDYH